MKRISYRGGVVVFSIPSTWKEEYEPDGGGCFYEDREGSCTLHLSLLTFKSQRAATKGDYITSLKEKRPDVSPVLLSNGNVLSAYESHGPDGSMNVWEVARLIPPDGLNIAVFSLEPSDGSEEDVALVERIIRDADVTSLHPNDS